jgi:hypothetical protein
MDSPVEEQGFEPLVPPNYFETFLSDAPLFARPVFCPLI